MIVFKKRRKLIICLLLAAFTFWLVTAPAAMAVQRIAAGFGNGPFSQFVIRAADCYAAPMSLVCNIPFAKKLNDNLADKWCDLLNAPETTP